MAEKEELWDLYDKNRRPLGIVAPRGKPLPPGAFFLAVAIWVVNSAGQLLVTLRAPEKENWAGYWENTGGAVQAGENSLQAAVRELREETGITAAPADLRLLGSTQWRQGFMDIYLCHADIPMENIRLQPGETADARWVTLAELDAMAADGRLAGPVALRLRQMHRGLEQFVQACQKQD